MLPYMIPLLTITAGVYWGILLLTDIKQLLKDIRDLLEEVYGA
jgi:hypothetical protein